MSNPATPSQNYQVRYPAQALNLLQPFDESMGLLENTTGLILKNRQVTAFWELYCGKNVLLVAKTEYDKTLVMTGYHALLQPGIEKSLIIILSPLKGIENGKACKLTK